MRSRSDLDGGTLHSDFHHDTMACAEKKTYPPGTDTYPTLGKGKTSTQKCLFWGGYVGYQEGISNCLSLVVLSKKGTYILNQNVTCKRSGCSPI